MASVNKVILIGKLGRDPELKNTPSGKAVCTLNIATTETWSQDGNKQERTEWHRVIVWGKSGENCAKYLAKGRPVYVEGRLQTRSWDDKDGSKRYATEIVSDTVQFLGSPPQGAKDESAPPLEPPEGFKQHSLDEIPF